MTDFKIKKTETIPAESVQNGFVNEFLRDIDNLSSHETENPSDIRADFLLHYDKSRWKEVVSEPENTLQVFITDRCNLRCPECFYGQWLSTAEMSLEEYKQHVLKYSSQANKVTLLGGEPTLHRKLVEIVEFNASLGLKTTCYTNGIRTKRLEAVMQKPEMAKLTSIRIGIHGLTLSEKPLRDVPKTDIPVTIVYMLAEYNKHELMDAVNFAENNFNCAGFFISSLREIEKTGDYWVDTPRTVPINQYAHIVQSFVDHYNGDVQKLHLSTRGVLVTENQDFMGVTKCRFGSILGDGSKVIAPLDISINRTSPELTFDQQQCVRHHKCVLQKIILERI
ncbi:MAG: radical SAM protein [bacterium]|nr:radical SAM protein [bacterium]